MSSRTNPAGSPGARIVNERSFAALGPAARALSPRCSALPGLFWLFGRGARTSALACLVDRNIRGLHVGRIPADLHACIPFALVDGAAHSFAQRRRQTPEDSCLAGVLLRGRRQPQQVVTAGIQREI